MDLVCGVSVPDDEFAILRCRDKVSSVSGPMHGVNLCQMTLQRAFGLHELVLGDGFVSLLSHSSDWRIELVRNRIWRSATAPRHVESN